jgi:hypothetical protein
MAIRGVCLVTVFDAVEGSTDQTEVREDREQTCVMLSD